MSKRTYPGTNWSRWWYLTWRHYERAIAYYGRSQASIGLIEQAVKCEEYYRTNMARLG